MNTFIEIIRDHFELRRQIIKLAKSDIIKEYRGAALGWAWAIIRPAMTIFVFWFGMAIGIRGKGDVDGFPYFLWLIAGFIPWFYMKDCLTSGSGSVRKYKYLVTRIKFPVDTIPTVVSLSKLLVNLGLQILMILVYCLFGYIPTIYALQILVYMVLMFMFFTGWSLFASMLSAMSKDFLNLVKALVQGLFWLSGILYDASKISIHWVKELLLFNPVTLLANGYRNALVYQRWFWENPTEFIRILCAIVIMWILAVWAYWKLKKDIPDVL